MATPIDDRANQPLKAEDLESTHWEDARQRISVHSDPLRF
jgi:hypothetical protein